MPWPRTYEGRPLWGRAGYTALHGAHLSSVPSGDQSANPASVPGRSGFQRALLSVSSARKRSGAERLAARGGKSTKIFYSSKSTITLLKFYLSTSKSTSLKIYSSKSKK